MNFTPVLLAGGNGARLAPLGTHGLPPKPYWPLRGNSSFLQQTAERVRGFETPLVVTQAKWATLAAEQLSNSDLRVRFYAEPHVRNTAAAALMAALNLQKRHSTLPLCLLPCDHGIEDGAAFRQMLEKAAALAREGAVVCFGAQPYSPASCYGYVLPDENGNVLQFVEKPNAQQAALLIAQGARWNAGIFMAMPERLIAAFAEHAPDILTAAKRANATQYENAGLTRFDPIAYEAIPAVPIDRAVIEKVSGLRMLAADCGWADLGEWDSLLDHGNDETLTVTPPVAVTMTLRENGICLTPLPDGRCRFSKMESLPHA